MGHDKTHGNEAHTATYLTATDTPNFGFPFTCRPDSPINVLSVVTANHAWFVRVREGGSITKIGLTIGVSSGNICAAALVNSGSGRSSTPGAILQTTGSIASPGTGYQELSLPGTASMAPGDWLAIAADNTTFTLWNAVSAGGGSNLLRGMAGFMASAFPITANPTMTWSNARVPFLVGVP